MTIVSDTTAVTNLFQIGQLRLLYQLYGRVIIPTAVFNELNKLPEQKAYLEQADWIETRSLQNSSLLETLGAELDEGEAEAIAFAIESNARLLIIDEAKGRRKAKELDIEFIGILGILIAAKQNRYINHIKPLINDLITVANFRLHPNLVREVLKRSGE